MKTTASRTNITLKPVVKTVSDGIADMKNTAPHTEKERLLAQLADIEKQEAEDAAEDLKIQEAATARKKREYELLLDEAELNEKLSLDANTAYDKKYYAQEALSIRQRIRTEFAEFLPVAAPHVEEAIQGEVKTRFALKQAAVIFAIFLIAMFGFLAINQVIVTHNAAVAAATAEGNTAAFEPAYGIDSFQRIFFFLILACVHVISVLGLVYVVNPNIFKYTISFFNTKPSAQSDFLSITPWERIKTSATFILGFLLYLAILFTGKL